MSQTPSQFSQDSATEQDLAEDLINWLEQQPELEYLRVHAARTLCKYKPGEDSPSRRIIAPRDLELPRKEGLVHRIWEQVWVPASNMRGKAYSTPELDRSLNSVAKLMCIGTLWDFFTTIPIFQFSLSSALSVLSLPVATLLSFILLISSNYAGENSTNRSRGNGLMANSSLLAFLVLCMTKTLFSGVGIDLWVGQGAIASRYAAELAATKLASDKKELIRQQAGGPELKAADQRCNELKSQMAGLDRNRDEKTFTSLYVLAYGSFADKKATEGLSNQDLIKRYGSLSAIPGVCRRADILRETSTADAASLASSIETRAEKISQLPAFAYLEQLEPDLFREHFRKKGDEVVFVNGTEAVGQATKQFYDSLFKGEFGLLGFSLFTLAISVILTLASAIMLYLISLNRETRASFTGELRDYRNHMLADYDTAVKRHLQLDP